MNFILANPMYLVIGFGVLLVISYAIIINLWLDLSYMKRRYNKMMAGVDGGNLEKLLNNQVDEVAMIAKENKNLQQEVERIDDILAKAITRIAVIRFDAFNDMSNDLSYCVAMLDSEDNGIVISGIFGREDSRTYVKPIVNGVSSYKLIKEEEQALREAMKK